MHAYTIPLLVLIILQHASNASAARFQQVQAIRTRQQFASTAGKEMHDPAIEDVVEAMDFLYDHMPEADRDRIKWLDLLPDVLIALDARSTNTWSTVVPWRVFLNDVLPYASLDERRDPWRLFLTPLLKPMVQDAKSITEAAQILNRDIWKKFNIVFKPGQTPEIMSPFQVMAAGHASCTGLSILLVAACRAVGIPARVAGTPDWLPTSPQHHMMMEGVDSSVNDDFHNHNWVEIWDDGRWSFTGAAEYDDRGLNRTWFFPQPAQSQVPGDRLHAIYAASWAPSRDCNTTFPLIWNPEWEQTGCDVTQSYLDARVLD